MAATGVEARAIGKLSFLRKSSSFGSGSPGGSCSCPCFLFVIPHHSVDFGAR